MSEIICNDMKQIKQYIINEEADAWVICDFASNNPAFTSLFGNDTFMTRKCFVIIDARARNTIICHSIDKTTLNNHANTFGYDIVEYNNWKELIFILEKHLKGLNTVLMEISERGLIPKASAVDYGTVCLIKEFVKNVKSSSDLFQLVSARLTDTSYELHCKAATTIETIKDDAFKFIFEKVKSDGFVTEYEVQQMILENFRKNNMVTDSVPIVAIGPNAGNPHYEPTADHSDTITKNDLVLIDLWAKYDIEGAVFADITWMGYVGNEIPEKYQSLFDIVKGAVTAGLEFLDVELPKRPIQGYELDDVCRNYIKKAGFEKYFIHRTGHSLSVGDSDHGVGVNIDNYETHDTRILMDGLAFSIEPGIYMSDVGIREEINVCIRNGKSIVTTPRQMFIVTPSHYSIML